MDAFTARYNFDMLVYYEMFSQVDNVIACEKADKIVQTRKEAPAHTGGKSFLAGLEPGLGRWSLLSKPNYDEPTGGKPN